MNVPMQPLSEVTQEAVAVLVRELGVARTLRFIGQYRAGHGDYTAERHRFLDDRPLGELLDEAQRLDRQKSAESEA